MVLALTSLASYAGQSPSSSSSSSASSSASAVSSSLSNVASSSSSSSYSSAQSVSSTSALKSKEVTLYVDVENGTETQQEMLYFLNGYGDVPFVCLNNAKSLMDRIITDATVSANGQQITFGRTGNTGKIVFDFANHNYEILSVQLQNLPYH